MTPAQYDREVRVRESRRSVYGVVDPGGRIVKGSVQFFVGSDHDLSGWRSDEGRLAWTWEKFALDLLDVDFAKPVEIAAALTRAADQGYRAQRLYLSTKPTVGDSGPPGSHPGREL